MNGSAMLEEQAITMDGELPIGLVVDGKRHRNFKLKALTVGDQVKATLEVGADDSTRLMTAIFARQLLCLGPLPTEKITTELLLGLNPADWNAIEQAATELQKKLLRDGPISAGGQPVAQSSAAAG